LTMAKIPPMAVKAAQMAKIAPRVFKIVRPMSPEYPRPGESLADACSGVKSVSYLPSGAWVRALPSPNDDMTGDST